MLPVVRELAGRGIRVSVDTMSAATALAAVEAGAEIINDVSGGLADAAMAPIVAETGVHYVAMHWRGHSDRMDALAEYATWSTEVRDELAARVDALVAAGVDHERLILDPGLGFAKTRRAELGAARATRRARRARAAACSSARPASGSSGAAARATPRWRSATCRRP